MWELKKKTWASGTQTPKHLWFVCLFVCFAILGIKLGQMYAHEALYHIGALLMLLLLMMMMMMGWDLAILPRRVSNF